MASFYSAVIRADNYGLVLYRKPDTYVNSADYTTGYRSEETFTVKECSDLDALAGRIADFYKEVPADYRNRVWWTALVLLKNAPSGVRADVNGMVATGLKAVKTACHDDPRFRAEACELLGALTAKVADLVGRAGAEEDVCS